MTMCMSLGERGGEGKGGGGGGGGVRVKGLLDRQGYNKTGAFNC